MLGLAASSSSYVNWSAIGKIVLVALVGGVGVVLVFGLAIEGVEKFAQAKTTVAKGLSGLLVALSGGFCVAAIVFGIYAMANPSHSSSSKSSSKKAAAFVRRAT
jgi:hypothetical protein